MSTAQLVVTAVVLEGRNNHSRALARIAWLLRARSFASGTSRRSVCRILSSGAHGAAAPDPQ